LKIESKKEVVWKVATINDGDGAGWVLKKPGPLDCDLNTNPEEPHVGFIYHADEGSPPRNTMNETIQTCMYIAEVDWCPQLVIVLKKFKEHEDKMNTFLAKEEVLVGAGNEHDVVVREYGTFNPVVKG
jgi:hypothetical protein